MDVAQLDHAVCSVKWRRAVVVSQHALRAALHIVNRFQVKLALVTFVAIATTAVDISTICNNRLLFFCGILCLFGVVV